MGQEEEIYLSMMGELVSPVRGVENAFEPGSICEEIYQKIYQANFRICERLGVEEDSDVESIISNFFALNRELCIRMYRYGKQK